MAIPASRWGLVSKPSSGAVECVLRQAKTLPVNCSHEARVIAEELDDP